MYTREFSSFQIALKALNVARYITQNQYTAYITNEQTGKWHIVIEDLGD